ncbi:DUF3253 domain-containing protein [Ferruginivarius sediminum]|uniref:DUF3253 domain-containing protein n=1 Tax=Ferruginivarius sediminum TaxID=2661937 RepID=UPI00137AC004
MHGRGGARHVGRAPAGEEPRAAGRISILRRGRPVDPNVPIKGVVRLALPDGEGWRITKIGRRYYRAALHLLAEILVQAMNNRF